MAIIEKLGARGAEGVILSCTEIPLLVSEAGAGIPQEKTDLWMIVSGRNSYKL